MVAFAVDADPQIIADTYKTQGYVVIEKLIPQSLVDDVLRALEQAKSRRSVVYYSQSVHRWVKPRLSRHSYWMDSVENPTWHIHLPKLRQAAMRILYHRQVSDMLMRISGKPSFVSWQDMLFDRSVGTIDHQDSWYLDTQPHGHLVAGWFSLEDIHPDSGPFFVYPGSHNLPRLSKASHPTHEAFLAEVKRMVAASGLEKKQALLKKGDVLFWHPSLVHGADSVRDERYSRKSLTSHYYPVGYMRTDSENLADDVQMMRRTDNPVIFRKGFPELSYVFKGHMKFLKDRLLNDRLPITNMDRDAYENI
jgi:phytanoyl-CoA hydroxylase